MVGWQNSRFVMILQRLKVFVTRNQKIRQCFVRGYQNEIVLSAIGEASTNGGIEWTREVALRLLKNKRTCSRFSRDEKYGFARVRISVSFDRDDIHCGTLPAMLTKLALTVIFSRRAVPTFITLNIR